MIRHDNSLDVHMQMCPSPSTVYESIYAGGLVIGLDRLIRNPKSTTRKARRTQKALKYAWVIGSVRA